MTNLTMRYIKDHFVVTGPAAWQPKNSCPPGLTSTDYEEKRWRR